ncbi:MAG: hypothetical protein IKJ74_02930 [Clostridia bacterium]|nr:hypothetical protein [Clostridia bacterium]
MKTAQKIYEKSLALLGQDTGENTKGFEMRAPALINLLMAQLSDLDLALKGKLSTESGSLVQICSLQDAVGMEDVIVLSLAPLGLAALLIQEEEPERSRFFWQLYQNERLALQEKSRFGRRHKVGGRQEEKWRKTLF